VLVDPPHAYRPETANLRGDHLRQILILSLSDSRLGCGNELVDRKPETHIDYHEEQFTRVWHRGGKHGVGVCLDTETLCYSAGVRGLYAVAISYGHGTWVLHLTCSGSLPSRT
jgi:hypothetical protein